MTRMASLAAGIVLVVFGAFVLLRGGSVASQKNVLSVGDVTLTTQESRAVPPWAAGIAVAAGLVLLVAGARQRA